MITKLEQSKEKLYQVQYEGIVVQEKEDLVYLNLGLGELVEIWKMDINSISDIRIGEHLFIIKKLKSTVASPVIIISESLYKFYKVLGKI